MESLLGFERRLCPRLRELGRLAAVALLGECVLELLALAVALLLDPVDTVNGGLRACVGLLRSTLDVRLLRPVARRAGRPCAPVGLVLGLFACPLRVARPRECLVARSRTSNAP